MKATITTLETCLFFNIDAPTLQQLIDNQYIDKPIEHTYDIKYLNEIKKDIEQRIFENKNNVPKYSIENIK